MWRLVSCARRSRQRRPGRAPLQHDLAILRENAARVDRRPRGAQGCSGHRRSLRLRSARRRRRRPRHPEHVQGLEHLRAERLVDGHPPAVTPPCFGRWRAGHISPEEIRTRTYCTGGTMGQAAYIYALVGNEGDATVLRYRTEIEAPLPGADVPTTPAVGPVV